MKRRNMAKNILLSIVIAITILLCGCETVTYNKNGVPSYFLEPDGYIIVMIDDGSLLSAYGYITDEDLQAYKDGNLGYTIYVQNAFTPNKGEYVTVSKIKGLEVGYYVDYDMKRLYE
jgi:hypothetical protein